jgi:flagellar basal-body rod protein FlgG
MIRALHSSAAGMQAQQLSLDVIANNLANVQTTGFKKSKIEFQDLLYQTTRSAGASQGGETQLPTGIQVGHGAQPVATAKIFTTGELTSTDEQWDIAIQGDGFFRVTLPSGELAYTRDGAFKRNSIGALTTSDGLALDGGIVVPEGARSIDISPGGEVTIVTADGNEVTELRLHRFSNPAGLESMGRNLYRETDASGEAEEGKPNEQGFGALAQGYLEKSNVKVIEEMVNMIVTQRAYEVNSKSVKAADDMMEITNNLKR